MVLLIKNQLESEDIFQNCLSCEQFQKHFNVKCDFIVNYHECYKVLKFKKIFKMHSKIDSKPFEMSRSEEEMKFCRNDEKFSFKWQWKASSTSKMSRLSKRSIFVTTNETMKKWTKIQQTGSDFGFRYETVSIKTDLRSFLSLLINGEFPFRWSKKTSIKQLKVFSLLSTPFCVCYDWSCQTIQLA